MTWMRSAGIPSVETISRREHSETAMIALARFEVNDVSSVFAHYRTLVELRHTLPVVAHGDFHMLLPDHPQVYAYVRRLGDSALLVLANLSGDPATIDVPDAGRWRGSEVLLTNVAGGEALSARCTLQPWEARVHRTT